MAEAFGALIASIVGAIWGILRIILGAAASLLSGTLLYFFARYRFNPLCLNADTLRAASIGPKYLDLFRWLLVDFLERDKHKGEFREYGFTFFVGRQGAGKTITMVQYLEEMKQRYPDCLVVSNFGYARADHIMEDWRDLLTIRNGEQGVIFAIDEIHTEYTSTKWADVPESLLSEISQQRKQRIKIVATAQFFTRVAKSLREQAATVVVCNTFLGRLTIDKEYDALEYANLVDNPLIVARRVKPLRRSSFVQSDALRQCYDTYAKVERMKRTGFIPRADRGIR